jgi:hypothetical protein
LNNNRGNNNNNRRRGRGNNNGGGRPQGGGNQQVNRIDSRARGNAPQLLEKYRKLAHDAHLNGDRVTAEYYLQFADHYFRVIADTRLRQEEARARRDDRWQDNGEPAREEADDSAEFSVESDFPAFDQPPVYTRREREDRPEGSRPDNGGRGEPRRREDQPRREEAPRREAEPVASGEADGNVAAPAEAQPLMYEPPENPFLRESRVGRAPRARREPREDRRPAKVERREATPRPRLWWRLIRPCCRLRFRLRARARSPKLPWPRKLPRPSVVPVARLRTSLRQKPPVPRPVMVTNRWNRSADRLLTGLTSSGAARGILRRP